MVRKEKYVIANKYVFAKRVSLEKMTIHDVLSLEAKYPHLGVFHSRIGRNNEDVAASSKKICPTERYIFIDKP